MADPLEPFYKAIDGNKTKYIERLREYCAIPSVSGQSEHFDDTVRMVNHCAEDLNKNLGITDYEVHDNPAGSQYPPILLATLGEDPNKNTLLVYGHLDVQPADGKDWDHQDDPFKLTKVIAEDGTVNYYARGSTDDKGPVLGWVNAIEAYQQLGMEIPVNIKFCLEAMEESGGAGLDQLIENEADFFEKVDYVCISDNYWLGQTKPCVTYGLRGISYYNVTIKCADSNLHSGVYGGTVYEAMIDLINIFSKLTDGKGNILIPGVNDDVDKMTPAELESYTNIDFDPEAYRQQIGTNELIHPDKIGTLTHRWRYPSLSIHGFVGASDVDADQTIIPQEVRGKFSIRLVPSQDPAKVDAQVEAFVKQLHNDSASKNDLIFKTTTSAPAWKSDPTSDNYVAGINAQQRVWGLKPDLTREGGSIPVTITLQTATGADVMLLPVGQSDDGAHAQNEKMSENNYINGAKVLGTYLDELGKFSTKSKGKGGKGKKK